MRSINGKRGLLRVAALGQVLLLVVAGCKSPGEKGLGEEAVRQALVGKDGDLTVNANTVVNGYAALTGTPSATTVTVADLATFTAGGTRPPLAVGDLVLIIQMAGATITTPNDATYGTVLPNSYNNAGNYEFAGVAGINTTTNTITLGCARQNAYTGPGATPPGRAQVIRVPQYGTLRINSGFSILPDAWNGTVGGVVAVQAATTLQLNGTIDASGMGFRGGVADNVSANAANNVTFYRSAADADGAQKGESIAGPAANLAYGGIGRGAPANGGGGGNSHNGGGGGGANAGTPASWTGQGVMLATVTGAAAAWALELGVGVPFATSSGGGRGGYTYSNTKNNATTVKPGNGAWGGNDRRERGGLGGHPLTSSPGGRLFLGGGGGAGDGNNGFSGSGGPGGGLVFVLAGTVQGAGTIRANGANGGPATSGNSASGDAPGGGGGGGTVVVRAAVLSEISVEANGGVGGIQTINSAAEAEGPGGGGGGGYVALSGTLPAGGTAVAPSVKGGVGGTTNTTIPAPPATRLVSAVSEFPSNGATAGHDGVTETFAVADGNILYCTSPSALIAATPRPLDPTTTAVGTFSFTSPQSGVTFECSLDSGAWQACAADNYKTPALSNARHTIDVRARDINGNVGTTDTEIDSYSWTVNATGPVVAFVGVPATLTNVAAATFTFSSSPPTGVTFECRLDGTTWQMCSSPYTTDPTLPDGPHTLEVRGISGGTTGDSTDPYHWVLDTIAPNAAIVDKPPKVSTSATGLFTFSSDDTGEEGVTFECRIINFVAWKTCSASYTAGPLAYGLYTLEVRARDRAGNVGPSDSYSWDVHLLGLDAAAVDSGSPDAAVPDAAVVDGSPEDTGALDTRPDSTVDGPGSVVLADARPDAPAAADVVQDVSVVVVDARADGADADIDGLVDAIADAVVRDAVVRDTQVVIDAIVLPDLAPDAQIVDTAIPVVPGPDAAVNTPDTALPNLPAVRVMGAGACAVNPMSNSAPGLFTLFLVAAFGLLVFRRRR